MESMGEETPTTSPWMPFPGVACSWMNASCGRDLHKICSLWGGLKWEKFIEDCFLWKWPFAGAGEEWGETFLWRRSSKDDMWTDHRPHLLYPTEGGGEREFGSEFEPQKRGGEGKMFSRFSFYFFKSYSDLISNKLIWFPHVKSGLPMTVGAEQSPCPYLDPWALLYFLSLVQLKSGVINGFDGHLISSQGHPSTLLCLRAAPNARSWPLRAEISQHAVTQNCSWTSIFHLVFFLWS